jgi:hypothetical protein
MTFVGKWMELEIIMLSEINQTENDTYHRFLLIWRILVKFTPSIILPNPLSRFFE